jgi:hypothetical protein
VQLGQDIHGEAAKDASGFSVSLSADGKTVAIGATGHDTNGSNSGLVRVYVLLDGFWVKLGQDIERETSEGGYLVSLSADGETLAVGAPWKNGTAGFGDDPFSSSIAGVVRVYALGAGASLSAHQKLIIAALQNEQNSQASAIANAHVTLAAMQGEQNSQASTIADAQASIAALQAQLVSLQAEHNAQTLTVAELSSENERNTLTTQLSVSGVAVLACVGFGVAGFLVLRRSRRDPGESEAPVATKA